MYGLEGEQLFLAPTGEVQLTNLHRDEIVSAADLPRKFVAYTPCFRREAGCGPRNRRHSPRASIRQGGAGQSHDAGKIVRRTGIAYGNAEHVLQLLGLHYRVVELCTGDLGFASAKSYDIEVWSPGQDAYPGSIELL